MGKGNRKSVLVQKVQEKDAVTVVKKLSSWK